MIQSMLCTTVQGHNHAGNVSGIKTPQVKILKRIIMENPGKHFCFIFQILLNRNRTTSKYTKMHFAATSLPGTPLGELTALPTTYSWI